MSASGSTVRTAGRVRSTWRVAGITTSVETGTGGRIWSTLLQMVISLAITVVLWRALYAGTTEVAGVTHDQAVTYAVLAALLTYLQAGRFSRGRARDSVAQHVYNGTILYWFVRPVSPAKYHLQRAIGDIGYALGWVAAGYLVMLVAHLIVRPVSAAAGVWGLLSLLLGQLVAYLIALILDLSCFWTIVNDQILNMVAFAQTMFSGGFVPLWFFPHWFAQLSTALPFQVIVNSPMTIYVGRVAGSGLLFSLAVQLLWITALGWLCRTLWRAAEARVQTQGG